MDMSGEFVLDAPREVVWLALNDADVLRRAIPGCESLEKVSDTEFAAVVVTKVGPIKARFTGRVTLTDIEAPASYRISGEGQGGIAGFAKGGAQVALEEIAPAQTLLRYVVEAKIGGKIAQLGARLIDSTARKLAGQFFTEFAAIVSAPPQPASDTMEKAGA